MQIIVLEHSSFQARDKDNNARTPAAYQRHDKDNNPVTG